MTPLITLEDVTLGYPGRRVLEHVSFTIGRGEFAALVGPNGAGKTTLFRGILGLIPPAGGRIVYAFDRRARAPGYVPQKETLDPIFPITVSEVVLMGTYAGLAPFRPVGRARRALARRCLEQVGLGELAAEPFWRLSGGQKQRVLIARALAADPEVLLLDEPTSGIDPGAERAVMEAIVRLHRECGHTVLLVTHHVARMRRLVDTVVWVDDGSVTKGPADEMLAPDRLALLFGSGVG